MMTTTEDYKKMAIKALEKKERQKLKSRDGEITPRKGLLVCFYFLNKNLFMNKTAILL